jgi:4-hydroxybutyrate CoA-transferase
MDWRTDYKRKLVGEDEAVRVIKSGDRVMVSGANSAPPDLVAALCRRKDELENVSIWAGLLMYPFDFLRKEFRGHIDYVTIFFGPVERMFFHEGNVENFFFHFSRADRASLETARCNIVMCEVSPPDDRGFMCFGPVGIFHNQVMCESANTILVQVNRHTPYIYGMNNIIHVSEVDYIVEKDHPLPELPEIPIADAERVIGERIAERVPDGATIQIGLGGVANAVGHFLGGKRDLGVHSEMLTDSMMELAEKGVITGRKKTFRPGKMVIGGLCLGSTALYQFIDRNPVVEFCPIYYVNDPWNIARNDNFVSINNALSVDLTGQAASESIGFSMYSGTGGQLDFVRGAARSANGASYIALKSASVKKDGTLVSRIVSHFLPGTAVTTPRSDVMYVVTEHGLADLWNKTTSQRVRAMISVAHPEFRESLEREAYEAGLLH